LAVPVFYSLFDDAADTAIARGVSTRISSFRSAVSGAFKRRVPVESTLKRDEVKEAESPT
jgi:hypothetical protein